MDRNLLQLGHLVSLLGQGTIIPSSSHSVIWNNPPTTADIFSGI